MLEAEARALSAKYEEMLALRDLDGEMDPRARMARLAERFPGALREIDELPREEIERRITALAVGHDEPWMHATVRFHALTRGLLFAKRALRTAVQEWPAEALPWREELSRVQNPPRGRLLDLVYEKLGAELAIHPHEAKRLVFGGR